jgi:hypothetical protein
LRQGPRFFSYISIAPVFNSAGYQIVGCDLGWEFSLQLVNGWSVCQGLTVQDQSEIDFKVVS